MNVKVTRVVSTRSSGLREYDYARQGKDLASG